MPHKKRKAPPSVRKRAHAPDRFRFGCDFCSELTLYEVGCMAECVCARQRVWCGERKRERGGEKDSMMEDGGIGWGEREWVESIWSRHARHREIHDWHEICWGTMNWHMGIRGCSSSGADGTLWGGGRKNGKVCYRHMQKWDRLSMDNADINL